MFYHHSLLSYPLPSFSSEFPGAQLQAYKYISDHTLQPLIRWPAINQAAQITICFLYNYFMKNSYNHPVPSLTLLCKLIIIKQVEKQVCETHFVLESVSRQTLCASTSIA